MCSGGLKVMGRHFVRSFPVCAASPRFTLASSPQTSSALWRIFLVIYFSMSLALCYVPSINDLLPLTNVGLLIVTCTRASRYLGPGLGVPPCVRRLYPLNAELKVLKFYIV